MNNKPDDDRPEAAPITEDELSVWEDICEAATPGPWYWDVNRRIRDVSLKAPQNGTTTVMDFVRWGMHNAQPRFNDCTAAFGGIMRTCDEYDKNESLPNPNAKFIAASRAALPRLVAEVGKIRADLAETRETIHKINTRNYNLLVENDRLKAEAEHLRAENIRLENVARKEILEANQHYEKEMAYRKAIQRAIDVRRKSSSDKILQDALQVPELLRDAE